MLDQRFIAAYVLADWQTRHPTLEQRRRLPEEMTTAGGYTLTMVYDPNEEWKRRAETDALMPY